VNANETLPLNQKQARTSPEWLLGGVFYQINLRAFTPEGTLKAALAHLPRLAELGVTILYLCPVSVSDDHPDRNFWSPRQIKSGMDNPRNPYRIKDYYDIDPEYGTAEDYRRFVDEAHALGMRVMQDVVYLHCGPGAVFIEKHPDFVQREADGSIRNAAWKFPALNFDNPGLREYLWANMEWFVREFDVDGFRTDVSDAIPLEFWEEARLRLEVLKPDVAMLSEGTRKEDQLRAFDINYLGFGNAHQIWSSASALRKLWEERRAERPVGGSKFIWFFDNHDIANDDYENRVDKRWSDAHVRAALILAFTLDGAPFLYNGQEVADTARHSIFGRLPVDWAAGGTPRGKARTELCRRLCRMRRDTKALTHGTLEWVDNDMPDELATFIRTLGDTRILVAINLSDHRVESRLNIEGIPGTALVESGCSKIGPRIALEGYGYWVGEMQ
jgi:cyclomaltodextrinase